MNRLVRALIVTPLYPGPVEPQAGIFIHRQVVQLSRCGVECRVLVVRPAGSRVARWLWPGAWLRSRAAGLAAGKALDGIPVETVFYPRSWAPDEDVIPAMRAALCDWIIKHPAWQATDVVYAQFLWTGGAAALALRDRFGWPVAAIARGGEMEQWQATNEHCRGYVSDVLQSVDAPLANCHALRRKAEQVMRRPGVAVEVVYNGCDTDCFRPADDPVRVRRALGIGGDERIAVFCGSIESVKGISDLAAAWRDFSRRHPAWRLVVIGRCIEPDLADLLRVSGGRVTLTGELRTAAVVAWLQAADLYVQPSRLEGLANATVEAMAAGLPVISMNVGGQSELIDDGKTGWLVPPGDPIRLRAGLEDAARRPECRARMGAAARCTIVTRFDARAQASRLTDILARTAAARPAACA